MSAVSCLRSEDQFLCSICLDVFTDPVSTPCGHNFCKNCINEHWNSNDQYLCPMCKENFNTRPDMKVNTFISEMVSQFRQEAQQKASSSSSEQQVAKPGEVPCDVCTGTKLKALKSCLVCLTSYCETHLEPHLKASGLKRHQLMDPVENLEDRMCMKHDKPLELFCKTDQTCVCMLCSVLDHKTHEFVPLKEEYEGKKAELGKTEAEIQEMIQKKRLKIQEMKHSVDLSKEAADREKAEGVQVFAALKESVERSLNELIETIEEKQRTTEKQAEDFIKELEQEISELNKRSSEVEKLSHSEDHLHVLQNFPSLKAAPPTKDWTEVSVRPSSYEGTVVKAVAQLEETLSKQMKKLFAELKRVQQYAVDVTLDPDTVHPNLILSDDGKQVNHGDVKKNLPNNPERFSYCVFVLGKQSFSSGRFYFEVQVKGKTKWNLGVARESINRKGDITLRPQDCYWTIWLRNGNKYSARNSPPIRLSLKSPPQKVGVFVDYEEGLVSFYDVDAAALIYSFTGCSFTEKLYPFFCPCNNDGGINSAPLIICPVNQNDDDDDDDDYDYDEANPHNFAEALPEEMSVKIFGELDAESLCSASRTCKLWHYIIEESEQLWRSQCLLVRGVCQREVDRDRGDGLSWKVTLVRNYSRSCVKRDWLRGRYSHVSSAEELMGRKMVPLDAETWGEILQAELDR
ncbi:F-box only protein 48 [Scomber scombrus]|uniref:F-box only protein 48 n=1 Tax=Scomber scombrus TaxID=13677 RepID=UPI002DDA4E9A|nr:F-box only protein 48 [Scomber scombrus]